MGLSEATFEEWLRVAISDPGGRRTVGQVQSDRTWREELGRPPDPSAASIFDDDGKTRSELDEVQFTLKRSMEHLVSMMPMLGVASEEFRELAALAAMHQLHVAPEQVAECIACYRVLFGRPVDEGGYFTYLTARRVGSLVDTIQSLLQSAEAVDHYEGCGRPPAELAALVIRAAALSVVQAVTIDATLGSVVRLRTDVSDISSKLSRVEGQLARLEQLLHLRFDAGTSTT